MAEASLAAMTPHTRDLPPEMRARLSEEAQREPGVDQPESSERTSCLDLAGDLIGSVRSGTPDLATNPRYLEEAIVRDARRWRKNTVKRGVELGEAKAVRLRVLK